MSEWTWAEKEAAYDAAHAIGYREGYRTAQANGLGVERLAKILATHLSPDGTYIPPLVESPSGVRTMTAEEWAADIAREYARLLGEA